MPPLRFPHRPARKRKVPETVGRVAVLVVLGLVAVRLRALVPLPHVRAQVLNPVVGRLLVKVATGQDEPGRFDSVLQRHLRHQVRPDAVGQKLLNDRLAGLQRLGAGVVRQEDPPRVDLVRPGLHPVDVVLDRLVVVLHEVHHPVPVPSLLPAPPAATVGEPQVSH